MTRMYLIRHAEAMGNVKEFFQGRTDTDVTPKGRKQLDCLAERFKTVDFDVIYSSPLKRAYETAEAVNRYHKLPINVCDGLIEIDGGVWEGMKWADIPAAYPEEHRLWTDDMKSFHIKDGEAMTEIYSRITGAINKIAADNMGKTIATVSHGCALRNYLSYAAGQGIDGLPDVGWSDNTAVSLIEFSDDMIPHIIYKNDSSHLTDELSTLKKSNWCRYEEDK